MYVFFIDIVCNRISLATLLQDAAGGGSQCNTIAVNAFGNLLAAADACGQQDAADQMIDLAKQLNSDAAMISAAQIFAQQPRNTVSRAGLSIYLLNSETYGHSSPQPTSQAVPYCQSAPKNAELDGLFQCQFAGADETTFVGGLAVGSAGTIPFGMTSAVSPAGSCPAHTDGPVPDGEQLSDLVSSPGTASSGSGSASASASDVVSTAVVATSAADTSAAAPTETASASDTGSCVIVTETATDASATATATAASSAASVTATGTDSSSASSSSSSSNSSSSSFLQSNGEEAQQQNAQFSSLTASSSCDGMSLAAIFHSVIAHTRIRGYKRVRPGRVCAVRQRRIHAPELRIRSQLLRSPPRQQGRYFCHLHH